MFSRDIVLTDFHSIRPPFESSQEVILKWLLAAHSQAEGQCPKFQKVFEENLKRFGCKSDHIEKRGHVIEDFLHQKWDQMQLYRLHEKSEGNDLTKRMQIFEQAVDAVFHELYEDIDQAPNDLIHVSCTGYIAPSGAQKIVAKKKWGEKTEVIHAYHMGCYAAIPALRIAANFLQSKKQVDIVHTELCSLHTNPKHHEPDQIVVQTLFADGFMKYSVRPSAKEGFYLKLLVTHEQIIPQSEKVMTWKTSQWGFHLSLSKEIPVLIGRSIKGYIENLCKKGNISLSGILKKAHFAIHPGGPKIIDYIAKFLTLEPWQVNCSRSVLRKYGNMSSATLPHIWEEMLRDKTVEEESLIVSLAFGPGLSISGAILKKGVI